MYSRKVLALLYSNRGFSPTVVFCHGVDYVASLYYLILFYSECFEFTNHSGVQAANFLEIYVDELARCFSCCILFATSKHIKRTV
jgi:hypothetical protein